MSKTFLDRDGLEIVANNVKTRLKIVTTMPSTPENGMVRLYAGTDTADYKMGHVYQYNGMAWEDLSGGSVDLNYNPLSLNAQSGKSVSQAISKFITDNTHLVWESKSWSNPYAFYGDMVWTDGENVYLNDTFDHNSKILNKTTGEWENKTWNGLSSFSGAKVWTDGKDMYYSPSSSSHYKLIKETSTWENKTWNFNNFNAEYIWTDGDNTYISNGSTQKILNKTTGEWENKTWNGTRPSSGLSIWTDNIDIYHDNNYILNKETSTWEPISIQGTFYITHIWTDGNNIYCGTGNESEQYVFDRTTLTWSSISWNIYNKFDGNYMWNDGNNIYYSLTGNQYVAHRVLNSNIK